MRNTHFWIEQVSRCFHSWHRSIILQDLERSYDVQIDASQLNILDCKFSLNIDIKEKQLEAILDDWTMTNAIQFKKNNAGKYIVVGGQCY